MADAQDDQWPRAHDRRRVYPAGKRNRELTHLGELVEESLEYPSVSIAAAARALGGSQQTVTT